jgi:tripartite ATP-independent transporter DctM subunit
MGLFANLSGVTEELMRGLNVVLGRVRGGMSIATVFGNAIFAAVTGVSIASIAVFSKVTYPTMRALGYDKAFALGTVAGSSVLGMLIPPSILLIIYGVLAEVAIGKLFIAGILPGLLLTAIYAVGVRLMVWRRPGLAPLPSALERPRGAQLAAMLLRPWSIAALIVAVLGGMYGGLITPTEAGAIGAFGALLIALSRRQVTPSSFWAVLLDCGYTSGGLFLLLMMASMYSQMLAMTGLAEALSQSVLGFGLGAVAVTSLLMAVIIVLGCFLDSASILLLTVPLMVPIIDPLGVDKIWFGIVAIVAVEIGLLTPPLGLGVFAVAAAVNEQGVTVEDVFRGAMPFVVMMLLALAILIAFPRISTLLPGYM